MRWRFGSLAALLALAVLSACPRSPGPDTSEPRLSGDREPPPAVPVPIESTAVAPTEGHTPEARSELLDLMLEENQRWMAKLETVPNAPAYYLGYHVHEKRSVVLGADSGALTENEDNTARALDVEVRVGSPALDNTRKLLDPQMAALTDYQRLGTFPFSTDPKAVRHHLWLETDRRYREAALLLRLIKTQKQVTSEEEAPPDFSHEEKEVYIQPVDSLDFDRPHWEKRVKDCSAKARRGVATRGNCRVDLELNTVYFVNSEGSQVQLSWTRARFLVSVGVKADDGMPLSRVEQRFGRTADDLPDDAAIEEMLTQVNEDLEDLHAAPIVDPFVGPAILEGRATAVFFHEVFGHRIEGHRQKQKDFGQTFTSAVDKQIMPEWLTIYDDPTLATLNGKSLNGHYHFDDEGVRAQRAELVKSGVLKGFIMGRSPIRGFSGSNGHGRAEPGLNPVSRQGNLVVKASRSVPKEELYDQLIAEVKRQGKPYGMIFTDISGGFTNTSRFGAQSFKVQPIMAYRLYPDGKKELVRGVDIAGQPLTALESILSAGRPLETFNGMCGAESGWVPVSASAPSMLLESLEVERAFEGTDSNPVLPPPAFRPVAAGGRK